jgi:hypothetical protein
LLEFFFRDEKTMRITYTYGGGCKELIVASAYFPYDSDEPPPNQGSEGQHQLLPQQEKATHH